MFKDTHTITNEGVPLSVINLSKSNELMLTYEQMGLMKAHEKAIAIAMVIKLEIMTLLTISIDGYIRLWNQQYKCLFSLKIPSLIKITWNMKEIEDIKNKKSIEELLLIFQKHFHSKSEKTSPAQIYHKSKKLKYKQ